MYDRAVERGILPSMRVRWCCADFKEGAGAGRVTLTGVRRSESARRAKRNEMEVSGHKFSGSTEQFEQWQAEQVEKIKKRMLRKEGKHLNEDYFSVDKDREIRCIGGKDTIIVNPLLQWTEADVWYFLNEVVKVPHCELYDRGYKRIGCILCPMSSHKQKLREMKDYPHVKRGWIRAIKKIREGGGIARRTYTPAKCGITPPTAAGIGSGRSSQESGLDSAPRQPPLDGFSDSPSQDCACGGQNLTEEDLIAERIFDWWISQKSYSKWYADNYIQQYLNFDEDNGNMETNT